MNGTKVGVCKLCKATNKTIKMTNSDTTGFKRHLQRSHVKIYETIFSLKISKFSCVFLERWVIFLNILISFGPFPPIFFRSCFYKGRFFIVLHLHSNIYMRACVHTHRSMHLQTLLLLPFHCFRSKPPQIFLFSLCCP